ncbi:MAG TPA: hypothetical protein VD927_18930 [Chryseosolibacter sp.]|nr:hypothetical protein [Chryseosolibacter sp.]
MLTAVIACSQTPAQQPNSHEFSEPVNLAEINNKAIQEASGIAASISNEELLWTHNDSGNPAEIFLIDKNMDIRLTCVLKGVDNRDWEDIAVGPGPEEGANYLYVAEIGDNFAQYPYKYVYRFKEPRLAEAEKEVLIIEEFELLTFKLPDTRKDTETLMIHPKTKDFYVVSKRETPCVVYRFRNPTSTTDTLVAEIVGKIQTSQIVGGDISADGSEVLLKNYSNVFYWKLGANETIEQALAREPKYLPYVEEPQGEAIGFARDGKGFYTISEIVKGEKSYLSYYSRNK